MVDHLFDFILILILTALVSLVAVRLSMGLSHRLGILDKPDPRKSHRGAIPYLGGLGMLLAVLVGLSASALLFPTLVILRQTEMAVILLGAIVIFTVGLWDDVRPIRAVLKLALQIGVGAMMWWLGLRLEALTLITDDTERLGQFLSFSVTVGWYVALMNSINLVDGLDGLAGGICCLGALSLVGVGLMVGYSHDVLLGTVLAVITAGATMGYLFFNWHPARTFMGDGGSLLLGFLLATSSLVASSKTPTLIALMVPLVALSLPLFETTFSFLRRAIRGSHPFKPDRRHLHHRLLVIGLDQRRVVIFLLFMTAFLGASAIMLARAGSALILFNVVFLFGGLVLLIENLRFLEKTGGRNGARMKEVGKDEGPRMKDE
ncbi:MAG: undecaprenyl/decaprenyl-phosphate alpha-N-acetylglucosaminyl 1-phosphate transferase [Candidatus Sumerlaeia bacterium]|nr:undecaprenyl/decaprenyl-phosphate alpha-N-acetylglucosaminyl 1-phosphate transferase [Candidatus Sumerlaeia bacterium]